jgi:hypothetical protein
MNRLLVSKCPQCGAELFPAFADMIWSEHRSDHCARNVWSCEPADISPNIQSIFVRAGIGPVIALIPKQIGDGRCHSSGDRSRSHNRHRRAAVRGIAQTKQAAYCSMDHGGGKRLFVQIGINHKLAIGTASLKFGINCCSA